MNDIIKNRLVEKKYLTVVHGLFDKKSGELRSKLEKDAKTNTVHVNDKYGKESVTRYKVLKSDPVKELSLLEVELLTGRTHQIRVHLSHLGHPLVGDFLYGTENERIPRRFALHASHITLKHPVTGVWMCFDSDLPEELKALL